MVDFNKLQDGRRIVGKYREDTADDVKLSREVAGQITGAFAYWLSQKVQKNPVMLSICVGRDEGSHTEELAEGAFEAISLWGAAINDAGIATTQAVAAAPILPCFEIDGSVAITADTEAEDKIGFRFFTADGEPEEDEVKEILRLASRYNFIGGEYEKEEISLMKMFEMYSKQSREYIVEV